MEVLYAFSEESNLFFGVLDDVELQSATVTELQHLKHILSTKRQAVLSNRSTNWWKLSLAQSPAGLQDDAARDPAEALKQLVALVATAPSQALEATV